MPIALDDGVVFSISWQRGIIFQEQGLAITDKLCTGNGGV